MAWNSRVCSRRSRSLVSSVVALLFCLGSLPASGEPAKDPKQEARAHFAAAQSHYNLNEFADALREFKESYRLFPDPVFLFNLGQCERQLGHPEEAIRFYRSYLREQPKAPNRQDVLNRIAELEASTKNRQTEPEKSAAPEPAKPAAPTLEPMPAAAPVATPSRPSLPSPAPPAAETAPAALARPLPAPPPINSQSAGASPDRADLTATPEREPLPTPVYKRWWFWTAAVAVAAGASVAIYYAATAGNGPAIPSSSLGPKKVF